MKFYRGPDYISTGATRNGGKYESYQYVSGASFYLLRTQCYLGFTLLTVFIFTVSFDV